MNEFVFTKLDDKQLGALRLIGAKKKIRKIIFLLKKEMPGFMITSISPPICFKDSFPMLNWKKIINTTFSSS
jgi:hypothetical protein